MLHKNISNYYPNKFAIDLSNKVKLDDAVEHLISEDRKCFHMGLYDDIPANVPDADIKEAKREKALDMLGDFQSSSIVGSFEDCLVYYTGVELNEEQIEALQFIYNITKLKLKGDMVNALSSVIQAVPSGNKDYFEMLFRLLTDPDSVDEKAAEATINFFVKEANREVKVTRGTGK